MNVYKCNRLAEINLNKNTKTMCAINECSSSYKGNPRFIDYRTTYEFECVLLETH